MTNTGPDQLFNNTFVASCRLSLRASWLWRVPGGRGGGAERRQFAQSGNREVTRAPRYLEIIIPAFNEERRISGTIAAATEYLSSVAGPCAVVVVDNGSVDRTPDIVREASTSEVPVHLVGCSARGKGAAVRRGILTGQSTLVGYCDADLATPFDILDDMLPVLQGGVPIVVGSRYMEGAHIAPAQPVVRRLGGRAFRGLTRAVVPEVEDTQCGFKFFHGPVARELFRYSRVEGFAFDVEVLALARRLGYEVVETPVSWSDVSGSSFHVVRDGLRSVADMLDLWAARWTAL
jgi:dolichyl-phosphate beta-glucosyltransferase